MICDNYQALGALGSGKRYPFNVVSKALGRMGVGSKDQGQLFRHLPSLSSTIHSAAALGLTLPGVITIGSWSWIEANKWQTPQGTQEDKVYHIPARHQVGMLRTTREQCQCSVQEFPPSVWRRYEKKCYRIILIYLLWTEKFRLQAFCRLYCLEGLEHEGLQVKHTQLRKRNTSNKE